MVVMNAVQGALSILFMIGVGFALSRRGWFDDKASSLIARLVSNIALPAYMVYTLTTSFSKEKLVHMMGGLAVPFISLGLSYLLSMAMTKWLKIAPDRRGVFMAMFTFSNSVYVGVPVNIALFGEESVPYALLYYIANTTLFWTIGAYGIRRDGDREQVGGLLDPSNLKKIISPPSMGYLFAILLILLEVVLPKSIMDTCKYIGGLTTPLSMIFIGIIVASVKLRDIRINRDMAMVLLGRYFIVPFLVVVLCHFFPMPLIMKKIFVIQASLPVISQTSILSKSFGADYEFAAVTTTVTTIVSLVTIPLFMVLLSTEWIF